MGAYDNLLTSSLGPAVQPFLDIPELDGLFKRMAADQDKGTPWTTDKLIIELRASSWWKKSTDAQRQWITLSPAEQESLKQSSVATLQQSIIDLYGSEYVNAHPEILEHQKSWAEEVASGKVPIEMLKMRMWKAAVKIPGTLAWNQAAAERRAKQEPENIAEDFRNQAVREYFLNNVNLKTARKWADRVNAGTASEADYHEFLKGQASRRFISLQGQLDQGFTPGEILGSTVSTVAQELGMGDEQFVMNGRLMNKFVSELQREAPEGQNWVRWARKQGEWRGTQAAKEMSAERVSELLRRFGANA